MLPEPDHNLLLDFLSAEPLPDLAERHGLSFSQLLTWLDSPPIRQELAALRELAQKRLDLLSTCLQTTCAATLGHLALTAEHPTESRRAATGAIRALPKPHRHHTPAHEPRPEPPDPQPIPDPPPSPTTDQPEAPPPSTNAPTTPAASLHAPFTLDELLGAIAPPHAPAREPINARTQAEALLKANGRAPP